MRSVIALACGLALLAASTPAAAQFGRQGGRGGVRPPQPAAPEEQRPPADKPSEPRPADGRRYGIRFPKVLETIERGEGREALAFFERVAAESEQRGARVEAIRALSAAAFAAYRLGMNQKAIRAGTRAVELAKDQQLRLDDFRQAVGTHIVVGNAYGAAGDLNQARRLFEEGLAYARSTDTRPVMQQIGLLSTSLSVIAAAQGDYAVALARALEAADLFEKILREAGPLMPEGLKTTARRHAAATFMQLARIQLELKRFDEAEAALKRASAYAQLVGLAEVDAEVRLASGTLALARGDHARAAKVFEQGAAEARRVNSARLLAPLQQGVARSYAGLGRNDDALGAAQQAIGLIEEMRNELQESSLRSGFLEDKQQIYQLAVQLALGAGKTEEAFAFAERSRARAFLDLLGGQTTLSKGRTRALVEEEVRLRGRLAEARAATSDAAGEGESRRARELVEAADRDYRAFLDRVRKENLEQASLMSVEPVSLNEVQALLPDGTTLLQYLVGESEVIVWVADRQRVTALRLPGNRSALLTEVRELRGAIASHLPLAEVEKRALALYQRLIGPAQGEIRGTRLLIVPHDVLHYLPFVALRTPAGKWLVEEYALGTLPSASVLKYLKDKGAQASATALAIGNPDLGAGLNLRWAEREARLVGQRLPSTTVLVRREATEAKAKALLGSAGHIHIAAHGELNGEDPLASALLLVAGAGEDGRLEVRELFGLELNARLVLLSACETGLGKLSRGDELVGLQRAFLYAGTPAVVTTLWKVDDRASFELVRVFYEHLEAAGPLSALRQAQLAAMRASPHPFFWAAFGLTGVPR